MELTAEDRIRWQSLLVAIKALEDAGENIQIVMCGCGSLKIEGATGQVQWDCEIQNWVFDGADGSEIHA